MHYVGTYLPRYLGIWSVHHEEWNIETRGFHLCCPELETRYATVYYIIALMVIYQSHETINHASNTVISPHQSVNRRKTIIYLLSRYVQTCRSAWHRCGMGRK